MWLGAATSTLCRQSLAPDKLGLELVIRYLLRTATYRHDASSRWPLPPHDDHYGVRGSYGPLVVRGVHGEDTAAVPVKVSPSDESTAFGFCACLLGNVTDYLPEVERFTSDI